MQNRHFNNQCHRPGLLLAGGSGRAEARTNILPAPIRERGRRRDRYQWRRHNSQRVYRDKEIPTWADLPLPGKAKVFLR